MSTETQEFAGRIALVTGGSRGIGRACCERIAKSGARVAINYLRNTEAAEHTASLVEQAGSEACLVQADVRHADQVATMVDEVNRKLGPIDLLVNNAGIFHFTSHVETSRQIWDDVLAANLTSAYSVTWAVKDGMVARKFGRIVNIASTSALMGRPMSIAYSASKAGLIGFTKSLAEALASDNVRVNAVAPGLIETEILDGVEQQTLDQILEVTPLNRIGQPDEIADAVYFLLSDLSRYMTGQTLIVSGGRVMRP